MGALKGMAYKISEIKPVYLLRQWNNSNVLGVVFNSKQRQIYLFCLAVLMASALECTSSFA